MASKEIVQTYIEYHLAITRRVWDSIEQITEAQFLADDSYSRGSIRNLMVHIAHADLTWLTDLKDLPDIRAQLKKFAEYPDRAAAREYWESVASDLTEYMNSVSENELKANPKAVPVSHHVPRWALLLHIANHGTDHRATVLQRLTEFGAPTFDQDFCDVAFGGF